MGWLVLTDVIFIFCSGQRRPTYGLITAVRESDGQAIPARRSRVVYEQSGYLGDRDAKA